MYREFTSRVAAAEYITAFDLDAYVQPIGFKKFGIVIKFEGEEFGVLLTAC